MSAGFLAPLAAAILVAIAAGLVQYRLRPHVAAQTLSATCVAVAAASIWALLAVGFGALAEIPLVHRWAAWCPQLHGTDDHVSAWFGLGAGAMLVVVVARAAQAIRSERRTRRRLPSCDDGVLVIDSAQPAAYAVPGRRGGAVVSTGMIAALEPPEREVLWAHERSHVAHRHHRYLIATEMAVAIVPLLRRLADQVHFATERWADEDAAVEVGGDRALVARAIARAALASVDHRGSAMALAATGVGARVRAMVEADHRAQAPLLGAVVGATVITSSLAGSTIQLHHLLTFVDHLCAGA